MNKKLYKFNRFLFLLILAIFTFAPNFVQAKNITIVHFSDTHLDTKSPDKEKRKFAQTFDLLERGIEKTNIINPDVVVFSGDMVNKPIETEFDVFLNIAEKLKNPFYCALGNHDVGVFGGLSKENIISKLSTVYNFKIDKPYYSIIVDDYIFVFMDGTTDKIISANGFFTQESLEFLDRTLSQNSDKKAIIVQHFPLVPPFESITHEIANKKEYFEIIDKHKNLIMVLAGHYHAPSILTRNNVLHITTPSMVQYPHAFRTIKIFDEKDKIIVETQLNPDEKLNSNGNKDIQIIKLNK